MPLQELFLAAALLVAEPGGAKAAHDNAAGVRALAEALTSEYPIAEIGESYAAVLRKNIAQARYDDLDACALADRLSQDLQAVHRDLHLTVACPKPGGAALPRPSDESPVYAVQRSASLPLFYLASKGGWSLTETACQQIVGAMSLAAGAKYVIIDLRDNPGGAGVIGNLIASYFYPLEDGHVLVRGAFRDRSQDTLEGTYPYVPGPRLPDAKVYILVNIHTGSAAEGLAFGLQHAGRAKVVGQTTAGAGIAAWRVTLPGGIEALVPRKLILAPDGSKGWEGIGVRPDIPTEPGKEIETVTALVTEDWKKATQ